MTRIMYVLRDKSTGKFYWKNEGTSSSHGFKDDFEDAHLFKTEKGAKTRMSLPVYSNCEILKVKIELL